MENGIGVEMVSNLEEKQFDPRSAFRSQQPIDLSFVGAISRA
jgi:hypothetical protein